MHKHILKKFLKIFIWDSFRFNIHIHILIYKLEGSFLSCTESDRNRVLGDSLFLLSMNLCNCQFYIDRYSFLYMELESIVDVFFVVDSFICVGKLRS